MCRKVSWQLKPKEGECYLPHAGRLTWVRTKTGYIYCKGRFTAAHKPLR